MQSPALTPARKAILLTTMALSLGLAAPARAEVVPSDVRSLGMAGATTAVVNGPYLQYYNPASITQDPHVSIYYPLLVPSLTFRTYNSVGSLNDLSDIVQSFVSPNSTNKTFNTIDLSQGFTVNANAVVPALGFSSGNLLGPFSVAAGLWGKASGSLNGSATVDASSFFSSVSTLSSGFQRVALGGSYTSDDISKLNKQLTSLNATVGNLFARDQNAQGNGVADGHLTFGLSMAYNAASALGLPFEISFGTTAKVFINPLKSSFANPIDASQPAISGPLSYAVSASTANNPGKPAVTQAQVTDLQNSITAAQNQLASLNPNDPVAAQAYFNNTLVPLANKATTTVSGKNFTVSGSFITNVPSIGFGMDFGVQANLLSRLISTGIVLENAFVSWPAKKITTTKVFSSDNSFNPTPTTTIESATYDASEPRALKWGIAVYPNLGDSVFALDVHKTFNNLPASFDIGAEIGILSIMANKEGANNLRAGSTEMIPLDISVRTGLETGGGASANWLFGVGVRYLGIRILDVAFTPIEVGRGANARSMEAGFSVGSSFQF